MIRKLALIFVALALAMTPGLAQRQTVVFWQFDTSDTIVNAWKKLVADFNAANPTIEVKMEIVPWADQQQRLITALTTGGLPDVSYMGNNVVAQFQAIGALEPLDRFMREWSAAEGRNVTQDYWPGDIGYYRIGGQYYAAPLFVETRVLYYRKDLFRQAGLDPNDPPVTWEEMIRAAQRLQRNNIFGWAAPLSIDYGTIQTFMSVWLGYGARMIGTDGRCGFNSPEFKTALSLYTSVLKGGTSPDATTVPLATLSRGFRDGKYAMFIGGPASWNALQNEKPPFLGEVGVAPIPRGPRGQAGFLGGVPLVMWKASSNKEAAAKFIGYATSPRGGLSEWTKAAGVLPARRSAAALAPWNQAPWTVFTNQLRTSRPYQYPSAPLAQMGQIEVRTVQTAVQQVALGQKSVDDATTELCNNLNGLLQR